MKKTILLTSLLASVASIAATSGSVEFYNNNETKYEKGHEFNASFRGTKTTTGVKTEVKVKETGLSFGADVKVKDYKIFGTKTPDEEKFLAKVKAESSVWAKYELPEIENVKSYVKAECKTKGEINVEGDAAYKLAEKLNAGLNSKTEFDLKGELDSSKVKSTHKIYLKGEHENVKDIYGELGFQHSYETPDESVKNVFLNAKASYMPMEDLTLTGKVDFKHTFDNVMEDDSLLEGKLKGKYRHSYLLGVKYTGIKDTELKLDSFIEHNYDKDNYTILNFGFKPEITYKGIPNLVLSSKNVFGGTVLITPSQKMKVMSKNLLIPSSKYISGYIKLNANAEYTYNITDKLAVKPSLDLTATLRPKKAENNAKLSITPKVKAEYKPIENLTISGDIAPLFNFGSKFDAFNYTDTTVKTSINVKYTW